MLFVLVPVKGKGKRTVDVHVHTYVHTHAETPILASFISEDKTNSPLKGSVNGSDNQTVLQAGPSMPKCDKNYILLGKRY